VYSPIPELNLLKEFDDQIGHGLFSDGFEFLDPDSVEEHSDTHEDYLVWLNENFGLGPPADVNALELEQKDVADQFRAWARQFVDLDD
jgi:hypothetical protein